MRLALLLVLAIPATIDAQVREVAHLQFYSAFWPNLHHMLYAAAAPADRPLPSPSSGDLTALMTDTERAAWAAIARRGEPYTQYLYAAGVIDRGWPGQRAALETHLRQYVDDETMPMAAGMKGWLAPSPFAFRIGFWNNLHHFLYVLGRARTGSPDSQRAAVVKAPADVEGLASRSADDRAAWDESIHSYAAGLSTKDAVFDAGLVEITRKLAAAGDNDDPSTLGVPPELAATLKLAAPVYRAVWWARHSRANAARRDDLQAQVEAHGAAGVQRLTALYQTRWSSSPQVVNLAAYANWAGAYSTTGGLIVFATLDEAIGGPHGLEILLHESSHLWDDEIDARLTAIARKQGKAVPSLLSHALIFYTSGEIVSELVPGHVPYAVKNGLWNQRGLGAFKPLLDQYWRPYIRGAATFDEAIAAILSRVP